MNIRAVRASDIAEISAFLSQCWHSTYDDIYGRDRVSAITANWHSCAALEKQLERMGTVFLAAIDAESVVGMAYASQRTHAEIMLRQLYVNPSHHGRGLAAELLNRVEAAFPDAELIDLEVEELNHRAVAFYRKHGYLPVGQTDNCGEPTSGIRALTFAKRLDGKTASN